MEDTGSAGNVERGRSFMKGIKMTKEDIRELFEKVTRLVDSNDTDYHCSYSCGEETWSDDGMRVMFEVHGFSDQGEGSEWTENWGIESDGRIYADDMIYDTFEEFEKDWI